jgi:hypothetical protein
MLTPLQRHLIDAPNRTVLKHIEMANFGPRRAVREIAGPRPRCRPPSALGSGKVEAHV